MITLPEKIDFHVTTVTRTTISTKLLRTRSGVAQHSVVFRLDGSAELEVEDQLICSSKNHVTVIPKDTPYTARYHENEMIFVLFTCESMDVADILPTNPESLKALFLKLVSVWNKKRIGFQLEADALLTQIFVSLARNEEEENQTYSAACAIIGEEFGNPHLSVESIAARVHVSPSQLRRIFNAQIGIPPLRFLNEVRVDHAAALLSSQKISVADAAARCGFNDTQYFARVVKKLRNCSPSQLRYL